MLHAVRKDALVQLTRLHAIFAVLQELSCGSARVPEIMVTQDIATALSGTNFALSAIRVVGPKGWEVDVQIALCHGVIGQETVGAGGISYPPRGIPVALDLVEQVKRPAPGAWVINASAGVAELWERTWREGEEIYMPTNREAAGSFERDTADLGTGGYDLVALTIMQLIANDGSAELPLNVSNHRLFPDLVDVALVEVSCRVGRERIKTLPGAVLPDYGRGLVLNAKYVERRTIDAVIHRSRKDALLGLTHYPLVDACSLVEKLLDETAASSDALSFLKERTRA